MSSAEWSVDPFSLERPVPEERREAFMLFACTVHGKKSSAQAVKCNALFSAWASMNPDGSGLLEFIRRYVRRDMLESDLKGVRMGQYRRVADAWTGLASLEPPFTVERLMSVSGVGPKTAHFIAGYTGGSGMAVLDRHVLRWLRKRGHGEIPEDTPQDPDEYARLAGLFLKEAELLGVDAISLDRDIWRAAAGKTARAYKLLRRRRDGTLGPLFINRRQIIPLGAWLDAEDHPTKGYARRPGWHAAPEPNAPHLSMKGRVWAEVELEDWTSLPRPERQGGTWFLAKKMRVNRILEGDEK